MKKNWMGWACGTYRKEETCRTVPAYETGVHAHIYARINHKVTYTFAVNGKCKD